MALKRLSLINFRNFSKVDLDFSKCTLLVGDNAQGKSNLLESIYFLATTKSPRADCDIQLIKEDEGVCRVEGSISEDTEQLTMNDERLTRLEIGMQKKEGDGLGIEKRVKVNGIPRRSSDYIGNLVAIHFSPEDINLVTGPPALRRWHLDLTLAQVDKPYKNALNRYHSALTSRNRILKKIKEGLAKVDELDFWSREMVASGALIGEKRQQFFSYINAQPSLDFGQFRYLYHQNIISDDRMREYLAREVAAGVCLIGPHRDDFIFKMDGKDLAYFGSRGEQRTAVLELKLAELKYLCQGKDCSPLLLLDDVFSELDEVHREYVISTINGSQVILSAVEISQVPKSFLENAQIIQVKKGKIITPKSYA
ncbi:hypothetical protein A2617_03560 [Candidatus Daviesbacteria bacterium RIFOXYD1_FULL_41_10]|uniref:DNA replication and repair protein RecF n=1 Tax=Candidatus Daviesbacteria bacterium RIFOXYD1_FULL_41_10 TaxID=1797801 RepID=A0A1F5N0S8_9BACT|nr:MAG: hypothetical protein A2617_03560 [Candidatus Daviesbacteria bacterium RIFOXYD1_FULL_41_10]